jgi:hypothetical protein
MIILMTRIMPPASDDDHDHDVGGSGSVRGCQPDSESRCQWLGCISAIVSESESKSSS